MLAIDRTNTPQGSRVKHCHLGGSTICGLLRDMGMPWQKGLLCKESGVLDIVSIVLTCGEENSGYELAQQALSRAGLAEAIPFRDGQLSPLDLTRRICQAHKVNASAPGYAGQITPAQIWRALSVDMTVANLDQADWGWADHLNLPLLEYWHNFDSRTKFVLIYSSPEQALARLLDKNGPLADDLVDAAVTNWTSYNKELLRFFSQNVDRCIMVNTEKLVDSPVSFLTKCSSRFSAELALTKEPLAEMITPSAVALWSASQLVGKIPEIQALFQDMESAADLPYRQNVSRSHMRDQALKEYRALQDQVRELEEKLQASNQQIFDLEALQKASNATNAVIQRSLDAERQTTATLRVSVGKSEEENQLLLAQLHSVQDELERYFVKCRDPMATAGESVSAQSYDDAHAARSLNVIDMRESIDGKNWHDAEHDGRWGGPGVSSILRLPRLSPACYELEIEAVDAIAPDILNGMHVSVDGAPIAVEMKSLNSPTGPLSFLKRAYLTHYRRVHLFPVLISGQIRIEPDDKRRRLQLEMHFPRTLSPASRGGVDVRDLTIRVKQVRLTRL